MEKDIIKATKEGKLYITTKDFFGSLSIKKQIIKLQKFAENVLNI